MSLVRKLVEKRLLKVDKMIKTFFLFLLFIGFDCFATKYGTSSDFDLIYSVPLLEAETIVIGKVVYEDDEAFIEVYESWKTSDRRIRISRGKFDRKKLTVTDPNDPNENNYGELPPNNQVIYFANKNSPSGVIESFSIFKWNTFSTFQSHETSWSPVHQKKLKELYGKLGSPKYYPNGRNYQIPKESNYFPFETWFTEDKILKDDKKFEEILLNAKIVSIVISKKYNNGIYFDVLKSWTSKDRILYVTCGTYDENKERPMTQGPRGFPHGYGNQMIFISYESPEKLSKPLKRIRTPQDNFPEYDFVTLNEKSNLAILVSESDLKKIENNLGKPKFDFEIKK